MLVKPPSYFPELAIEPPDTVPIHEFLFDESNQHGRHAVSSSLPPFTCGITGKEHSAAELPKRVDSLARSLASILEWKVNEGSEMDKVIGVFSVNTIDNLTASWATHRLGGASCPISATYSASELTSQLEVVNCKAIFTCKPLLATAIQSADAVGIPQSRIFLLEVPEKIANGDVASPELKTVDQLVEEGANLPALEELTWSKGQGARQIAYLCASSGTSGLPKTVKISHKNVVAHILQFAAFQSNFRDSEPETFLGVLPFSHIYALILATHSNVYGGDRVIVLPKFDLFDTLEAIQKYRIQRLLLVPPMLVAMTKAGIILERYKLGSVKWVLVGAAPLTNDAVTNFKKIMPDCALVQGYGLTETSVVIAMQTPHDILAESTGGVIPGYEARLIDEDGKEVQDRDTPGELVVKSPSVMLGYLHNQEATDEILSEDGWLRTGDLAEIRRSFKGHDHVCIVDRVKELIKVNGLQVSPVELESFLMRNPKISDAAVVPVPDETAGEVPRAYIVKADSAKDEDEEAFKNELHADINQNLAQHKRLSGGIEFVDSLPKSAAGKTLRKVLKEKAKTEIAESRESFKPKYQVYTFDTDDEDDTSDEDDL